MAEVTSTVCAMKQHRLERLLAAHSGLSPHDARDVLQAMKGIFLGALLQGESVELYGLGVWQRHPRKSYRAKSGYSGAVYDIPEGYVVRFRASKYLRDRINGRRYK